MLMLRYVQARNQPQLYTQRVDRSNLVTSLIEHEQIKTTLPKAKDTARLAEKVRCVFYSLGFVLTTFILSADHNGQERWPSHVPARKRIPPEAPTHT